MRILERGDVADQPFRRQRGGGGHGQHALLVGPAQAFRGAAQIVEGGADGGQVVLRLPRQFQAAVAAEEQLQANLLLQPADLVADGGLGHVQFRRRQREAHVAGRRFEGAKAVQGGQHPTSLA